MVEVISVSDLHRRLLTEIESGGGLSPSAAGKLFPAQRGPGTVGPSTVFRWMTKGTRTGDGRVVKLEAIRVGSRWLTSRDALARFIGELTDGASPTPTSTPKSPTPKSPVARGDIAESQELDALGMK